MDVKAYLQMAIDEARKTMNNDEGGPFGAVVVDTNDGSFYVASNSVLATHDPTAHAEINAIREACKKKGTHDLSGCILYTTCYPCPMCLSASIWANIKEVYYGCTPEDAEAIGFRDDYIYRYIQEGCKDQGVLNLTQAEREMCLNLFGEYAEHESQRY
ncbi:MAG: CMP/dCMP deaminase zinc-binding protein [Spirochaeta sp.]|jgi:guanine deaminase|uniref:nucleoside deaminase n=1 Tax=Sphaerochaeta sp. TaxID=1972642 RepID=UPI003D0C94B5|nr:CMP/dCMP deaminase zinc-binding protein [Spirochaeta sp.]